MWTGNSPAGWQQPPLTRLIALSVERNKDYLKLKVKVEVEKKSVKQRVSHKRG
ncbi:hypothetical protein GMMP15_1450004 [Candidatus Magnetomoraceae bacterium gMMP-15]